MTTAYWKHRWEKESEELLKTMTEEDTRKIQEMYLEIAEELTDEFVAEYVRITNNTTITPQMISKLKNDRRVIKIIITRLNQLGAAIEDKLSTYIKEAYRNGDLLTAKYLRSINNTHNSEINPLSDTTITERAERAVKAIWADDGKNWSARVWDNTALLAEKLKSSMLKTMLQGKSSMDLTSRLMHDFSASYSNAKRIAYTEMSHAYNLASWERMKSAGIKEWEWYTSEDERVCPICSAMNHKKFSIDDKEHLPPSGSHVQCRCTVLAVIPT